MSIISIVVTVFNTEEFIKKCLDSILYQSFSNFEVIIINDGSTDNSGTLCKEYEEKDERFKVVSTKNRGVSAARNEGLKHVKSDWVCFIDSDDWIEPTYLKELYDIVMLHDSDFAGCGNYYSTENSKMVIDEISPNLFKRELKDIGWLICDTMFPYFDKRLNNIEVGSIRAVWAKLFKTSIIKEFDIHFDERLKIAEDALFCMHYFRQIKRGVFFNRNLYNYRINPDSALRKYRSDINEINLKILDAFYLELEDFSENLNYQRSYMGLSYVCICKLLNSYYTNRINKMGFFEKVKMLKKDLENNQYRNALDPKIDSNFSIKEKLILYSAKRNFIFILLVFGYMQRISNLNLKN